MLWSLTEKYEISQVQISIDKKLLCADTCCAYTKLKKNKPSPNKTKATDEFICE